MTAVWPQTCSLVAKAHLGDIAVAAVNMAAMSRTATEGLMLYCKAQAQIKRPKAITFSTALITSSSMCQMDLLMNKTAEAIDFSSKFVLNLLVCKMDPSGRSSPRRPQVVSVFTHCTSFCSLLGNSQRNQYLTGLVRAAARYAVCSFKRSASLAQATSHHMTVVPTLTI
eukprot:GHRR01016432.1.p1 GENE.GHRR01016432.1~~GHRR01016432.1.p1  ORF type:complete len:169 (-),score=44.87 GHRR01016432.1:448-954(-)